MGSHNLASTLDGLTLSDLTIGTEKHNTDMAGFQVHAHALDTGGELDELLGLDVAHAINTGNTVTNGQDATSLGKTRLFLDTADPLLENGGDFGGRGLCLSVGSNLLGGSSEGGGSCDTGLQILMSVWSYNGVAVMARVTRDSSQRPQRAI